MRANEQRMHRLTDTLPSKSEKMRVLAKAGYGRKAIADFLDVRYQFVRNVLVQEEARAARTAQGGSHEKSPEPTKLRLGPDGRIVIPAAFRETLGLSEGDILIASIDDGELNLLTRRAAVKRARAIVRQFVPEGVSLVDELIEDRRREAAREEDE